MVELRELVRVATVKRMKTIITRLKSSLKGKDKDNIETSMDNYNNIDASSLLSSCNDIPLSLDDFNFALTKTSKSG